MTLEAAPQLAAPTRVFVVEDDELMRAAICESLAGSPDLTIVGCAATASEAIAAIPAAAPDVALVDLALGDESGVDVIRALRERTPRTELMAHTVFDDRSNVFSALKAGATSYVLKGATGDELAGAIRSLVAGGAPMSPKIARLVIRELHVDETAEPDQVTPRARAVLRLVDQGLTYKEIAAELAISVHTVHTHIKNVYRELEASGKRDALARARQRGLI